MTGIEFALEIIDDARISANRYRRAAMLLSDPEYYKRQDTLNDYAGFLEECVKHKLFDNLSTHDTMAWIISDIAQKCHGCLRFADEAASKGNRGTARELRLSMDAYLHFGFSVKRRNDNSAFA